MDRAAGLIAVQLAQQQGFRHDALADEGSVPVQQQAHDLFTLGVGALVLFGADLALATTGYAEPSVDQGVKVPYAWWALAHRQGEKWHVQSSRVDCPDATRVQVQAQVTVAVITGLIEYLRDYR